MKINKDLIAKLNPCNDRFENYIKFYGDKEFTKAQFMGLKHLMHEHKICIASQLMKKEQLSHAIAAVVDSVAKLFEQKYPKNKKIAAAIHTVRIVDRYCDDAAYENNAPLQDLFLKSIVEIFYVP